VAKFYRLFETAEDAKKERERKRKKERKKVRRQRKRERERERKREIKCRQALFGIVTFSTVVGVNANGNFTSWLAFARNGS
jgi:hypothetical protein